MSDASEIQSENSAEDKEEFPAYSAGTAITTTAIIVAVAAHIPLGPLGPIVLAVPLFFPVANAANGYIGYKNATDKKRSKLSQAFGTAAAVTGVTMGVGGYLVPGIEMLVYSAYGCAASAWMNVVSHYTQDKEENINNNDGVNNGGPGGGRNCDGTCNKPKSYPGPGQDPGPG